MVEISRLQEIFTEKVLQQVRKNIVVLRFSLKWGYTKNSGHFF